MGNGITGLESGGFDPYFLEVATHLHIGQYTVVPSVTPSQEKILSVVLKNIRGDINVTHYRGSLPETVYQDLDALGYRRLF